MITLIFAWICAKYDYDNDLVYCLTGFLDFLLIILLATLLNTM